MSRSQFPLTPTMSGGFIVQDHQHSEVEASFALPPAAMGPIQSESRGKTLSSSRKNSEISFVPVSPSSPEFAAVGRTKSNTSPHAGAKRGLDEFSLPPPPTRTRKIIQVKPKPQPISSRVSSSATSTVASKSKDTSTASSTKATSASSSSTSRKKQQQQQQPSATSAAGRKIARKTAHSLIERRRRSKMNEEFSTLKNMIPACRGQEMHKLAILQASIEYVNYLEQCITDLKTASGLRSSKPESSSLSNAPSPSSPAMTTGQAEESQYNSGQDDSSASASASPELPPLSGTESAVFSPSFSPAFSPYNSLGQQHSSRLTGAEFPPHMNNNHASGSSSHILPSPALGPTQSPLISWRRTSSIQLGSASQSPAMLPQQPQDPHYHHHHDHQQLPPPLHRHSTSSYNAGGDAEIDHEASAALLMLNMDRRGIESVTVPQAESASEPTLKATMTTLSTNSTLPVILPRSRRPEESENDAVGRANTSFTTVSESSDALPNRKRKKVGMSVRDLLVS